MFKRFSILILLFTLILSPRILLGTRNEKLAQQFIAMDDYIVASDQFELAANRLFWRKDLWENVGLTKSRAGKKEEVIVAFEKARKANVLSDSGWDLLGFELWCTDRPDEALVIWQEGLEKYPNYFKFYNRLAMYYREAGNLSAEKDAIENWLSFGQETEDTAYFNYRFGLFLIVDSPEDALAYLVLAARADEEFAPVVDTLRTSLNLALLENDPAEKQILLGRGLALAEEWQLAAEIFTNATQTYPESASAWAWLGEAKQHLGQNPLPDLDKALNLQLELPLVRSLRGLYWQRQGSFEEAVDEFKILVALEPENPSSQAALGDAYARLGDLPPALDAYSEAVLLAPEDPAQWHLLALFSVQYGVQIEEIGLPAAKKAVELSPTDAKFIDTLGWLYFSLGDDESAATFFADALLLDPDLSAAHLHLGMFYLKHTHNDLAYQSLLRAQVFNGDLFSSREADRLLKLYFPE